MNNPLHRVRPRPGSRRRQIEHVRPHTISLTDQAWQRLAEAAIRENVSISMLITALIARYCGEAGICVPHKV